MILDVGTNYLTGSLPNSWRLLTSLQSLAVSDNFLSGTIPQGILRLPALALLGLSYNNFIATFSHNASQLLPQVSTSLQLVLLQNNSRITGVLPSSIVAGVTLCGSSIRACPVGFSPQQFCIPPRFTSSLTRLGKGVSIFTVLVNIARYNTTKCTPFEPPSSHYHGNGTSAAPKTTIKRTNEVVAVANSLISSVIVAQGVLLSGSGRFLGGTAVHSMQAALLARRRADLCSAASSGSTTTPLPSSSSGDVGDTTAGGSDATAAVEDPFCCDTGTSPMQLSISPHIGDEDASSLLPQFIGAVVGNTLTVGGLTAIRLALGWLFARQRRRGVAVTQSPGAPRCGDGSLESTSLPPEKAAVLWGKVSAAVIDALYGMFDYKVGPIAVMWTTYMMLVGPTIGTSVGLLLVVESSGALRFTGALGVCVWTIPWGVSIGALCWRERRLFPFRGAAAKGRRLWNWFQKVTEPTEELIVARSSSISSPSAPAYARMLLQRYAPVFEGYSARRFWYFNVEVGLAFASGVFTGISYSDAERNPCNVWTQWALALLGALEVVLAVTVRPFPVLLGTLSVIVIVGLSSISQVLLILLPDDPSATTFANVTTLICALLEAGLVVLALLVQLKESGPWRNVNLETLEKKMEESVDTSSTTRRRAPPLKKDKLRRSYQVHDAPHEEQEQHLDVSIVRLRDETALSEKQQQSLADLIELACLQQL